MLLRHEREGTRLGGRGARRPLGAGAPADRPAGDRGARGGLAVAATLTGKGDVRDALGTPAGSGSLRTPGGAANCVVYELDRAGATEPYGFCFRDGRLVGRFPEVLG